MPNEDNHQIYFKFISQNIFIALMIDLATLPNIFIGILCTKYIDNCLQLSSLGKIILINFQNNVIWSSVDCSKPILRLPLFYSNTVYKRV